MSIHSHLGWFDPWMGRLSMQPKRHIYRPYSDSSGGVLAMPVSVVVPGKLPVKRCNDEEELLRTTHYGFSDFVAFKWPWQSAVHSVGGAKYAEFNVWSIIYTTLFTITGREKKITSKKKIKQTTKVSTKQSTELITLTIYSCHQVAII